MPLWAVALATTLGMQVNASLLDQSLAVTAPLLTRELGLAPERIGALSSLSALGTVLFLLFGGPVLARLGPVRTLQVGALLALSGLVLASSGQTPLLFMAALLMGLGYGPTPPAGSRILAASAPPRHRTLIFSVKQAGAPIGGALAALLLAPIAAGFGWQAALLTAGAIGLASASLIAPTRERLDGERRAAEPVDLRTLFSPAKVVAPFREIGADAALRAVSILAFSFALLQGSLFSFSVTYLVSDRGMALEAAGVAYASMQAAGAAARIFLGWLADRTGRPALNLTVQAGAAALAVSAYAALPPGPATSLAMVAAGAAGFLAASWNGIFLAEVARLSQPDRVAEATASTALVAFLGYVSGPSLFALCVGATGSYRTAFLLAAAQLAAAALAQVPGLRRR